MSTRAAAGEARVRPSWGGGEERGERGGRGGKVKGKGRERGGKERKGEGRKGRKREENMIKERL